MPTGRGKILAALPYDGPRWYSREATQWLMRRSRMWSQVKWEDIKYTYTATAHLPADFFREPIAEIEASIPELAKEAVNSLLGLWSLDEHTSWMVATQQDEYLVLPHDDKVLIRPAPGGVDRLPARARVAETLLRLALEGTCHRLAPDKTSSV